MANIFDKLIELKDVAKILDLNESTLRHRILRNQIDKKYVKKFGTTWVFDKKYIDLELKKMEKEKEDNLKKNQKIS